MTPSFDPDYFEEIVIVEEYVYSKMKSHLTEKEDFCNWADSLINKFIDYLVLTQKSNLSRMEKRKLIDKYRKRSIVMIAINLGITSPNYSCRIKSWLIRTRFYKLISMYFQIK